MRANPALLALLTLLAVAPLARAGELIPPRQQIKTDRPRLLLRPAESASPLAVTLKQLADLPRDAEFDKALARLRQTNDAACQALAYRLTGESAAADKAIAKLTAYKMPDKPDSFDIYFHLREAALAYDWLCGYKGFTDAVKAEVRTRYMPLAQRGQQVANDHIFHNYTWMAAGGTALWALATVGDDPAADAVFDALRTRLNRDLYPAMAYLDGQFGESPGYWVLYDLSPCALSLLATQSAFESDVVGTIRREQNDWLARQLDTAVHATLPNLRFITWGDIQDGADGGVTREVLGVTDAMTWALGSGHGAFFSRRVGEKVGLDRFFRFQNIFYFLYTRPVAAKIKPVTPPLSHLAGAVGQGGTWIARSGWGDGDTVVAFRCTNFYGGHNHFDAGSFFVYRNGHLAADPDLYKRVGGSQQITASHNTLLLNGQGQRSLRAQWFKDVADYKRNLTGGRKLETGEILAFSDGQRDVNGQRRSVAIVSGRFDQAYPDDLARLCKRTIVFIRPDTVAVADEVIPAAGTQTLQVSWLLVSPAEPTVGPDGLATVRNKKSYMQFRLNDAKTTPEKILGNWHRLADVWTVKPDGRQRTVHVLNLGDGEPADPPTTGDPSALPLGEPAEAK